MPCIYIVHTHMYQVHSTYIYCTWVLWMVCIYHYGIFCCVLAWTGTDILSMYIPVWSLPVQKGWILYHSFVYELYIHNTRAVHARTQQNIPKWYIHTICRTHVQRMYMSVHWRTRMYHVYTYHDTVHVHPTESILKKGRRLLCRSWACSQASHGRSGLMRSEVWLWRLRCTYVSVPCS